MSKKDALPACPRCQIGFLRVGKATYSGIHHAMLVSVPNMPSHKCDVCGYVEFEESALAQIGVLVGQMSVTPETVRPMTKLTAVETDAAETNPLHRFKP